MYLSMPLGGVRGVGVDVALDAAVEAVVFVAADGGRAAVDLDEAVPGVVRAVRRVDESTVGIAKRLWAEAVGEDAIGRGLVVPVFDVERIGILRAVVLLRIPCSRSRRRCIRT